MTELEVSNVRKIYRTRFAPDVEAVRGVSFCVHRGECLGILGANGAGKSTAMSCITGFYPVNSGVIKIHGFDVHRSPRKARKYLGYCSQEDSLDSDFSVIQQLIRHGTYFGLKVAEAQVRAIALLSDLDLIEKKNSPVEFLSGGMKRRVQVARALIASPDLLVLDEPTTGLDPDARRLLWKLIMNERERGSAILLSTHYMEEAERLCDRIVLMDHGQLLDVGKPAELVARHCGEAWVEDEIRPGLIIKRPPGLEDVFMKLSGSTLSERQEYE